MAFSSPTWGALLPGPAPSTTEALSKGTAVQQQVRLANALRGVDINNPSSVDQGITAAIQNGALEQANALSNLNFTRSMRAQLPSLSALASRYGGGSQSSAAPTQAPAPDQSPTDTSQMQPGDVQHYTDTMNMAAGAANDLLKVPAENRQAVFGQMRQQFIDRGVPPAAIDAAAGDLSDSHLQDVASHYTAAAGGMAPGGQMPDMHPTTYAWYKQAANDPQLAMTIAGYKAAGFDLTPFLDTATKLAAPEIEAQARAQYAPQQAFGETAGKNVAEGNFGTQAPPFAGAVRGILPNGQPGWVAGPGSMQGITSVKGAEALGTTAGNAGGEVTYRADGTPVVSPVQGAAPTAAGYHGAVSGAETAATAAANAPYELVPGLTDPATGAPLYRSKAQLAAGQIPSQGVTPQQGSLNQASAAQFNTDTQQAGQLQANLVPLRTAYDLIKGGKVTLGPGSDAFNRTRSFVTATLGLDQSKVASYDEVHKYLTQIANQRAAQFGPGTNEKLAVAAAGSPNVDMSNLGASTVLRMNIALARAQAAMPANYHGAPEGYRDYASNYGRTVDPRAFMLDMLSAPERNKLLSSITSPSDKKAFLNGLQAAEAAGYYHRSELPGMVK